jgi:hypothetical protein
VARETVIKVRITHDDYASETRSIRINATDVEVNGRLGSLRK